MRLMVQKHNLEPSGTTAIICHKKTKSVSLSCNVLIQPSSSVSGWERQKKMNTLLQRYFLHNLWCLSVYRNTLIHVRNVTNRQ